ncbi:B3/4 domain-containing protein [Pedococcus aerophilus]|uniref:B3/4 domain-containing protein n=1 Tax=Pedococcus aerophilus TaxID=436356 RepID=A0ABN3UQI6_9MICO
MPERRPVSAFLAEATVSTEIAELRPDYRALLVVAQGLTPGTSDEVSDALLSRAEAAATARLAANTVEELPHVAAWRDAYRAFGAKPQRTRNSLEALTRRAPSGLPRVNRLTDVYNAISVLHQLPIGGEDLDRYVGSPRLLRATGTEPFDTTADGADVIDHAEPREVVWCDDLGVTCRRWNWRQGRRTALGEDTTDAVFILDALEPMTEDALRAAATDLTDHLRRLGPDVHVTDRLLHASAPRPTDPPELS